MLMANERSIRLECVYPDAAASLDVDRERVFQVLSNLLSNAIKYSPASGTVQLEVAVLPQDVEFRVSDHGIGIPQELLPRVFDMFAQAGARASQAEGGLGIGLALARRLVELHGGRLEARSDGPGRGSEFLVHLPLAAPP